MGKRSPVPPGAMLEINLDLLGEGKFRRLFERQLRRAYRELRAYATDTKDTTGKAVVLAKIELSKTPKAQEHWTMKYGVKITTPSASEFSVVKECNGRLLCQPAGSSEFDPDQQVMFDAQGRAIQGTDPETGEVVDPTAEKDVAGKISRTA